MSHMQAFASVHAHASHVYELITNSLPLESLFCFQPINGELFKKWKTSQAAIRLGLHPLMKISQECLIFIEGICP